jgi:anti-sigma factor RsiW
MTASEPSDVAERPTHVTETLVAGVALGSIPADWDADRAVTELYASHYRSRGSQHCWYVIQELRRK